MSPKGEKERIIKRIWRPNWKWIVWKKSDKKLETPLPQTVNTL